MYYLLYFVVCLQSIVLLCCEYQCYYRKHILCCLLVCNLYQATKSELKPESKARTAEGDLIQ